MKKLFYLCALTICLSACKKEQNAKKNNSENSSGNGVNLPVEGKKKTGYFRGQKITYRLIDGNAVFQGDIILPLSEISDSPKKTHAAGEATPGWNSTIYYAFEGYLPYSAAVLDAIEEWEAGTNIDFVLRTNQPNYIAIVPTTGDSESAIGMQGGRQELKINNGQYVNATLTKGYALHELGHAIGLWHEQMRQDRDDYINIYWDNIQDDKKDQFEKYFPFNGFDSPSGWGFTGLDFNSVMMYGSYFFTANGGKTMSKKDGSEIIENRSYLTNMDKGFASILHPKTYEGVGDEADGAGVAYYKIPGSGIKMLVAMAYDSPNSAPSTFRYRIFYDLDSKGKPVTVSAVKLVSADGSYMEGAGVAIGDIDKNGVPDLIMMGYDAPSGANNFRYKVGFNLNSNGDAAYWTATKVVTGINHQSEGSDVALGDIDKNGTLDMVLMTQDAPTGVNSFMYKIGFNLNSSGDATSWSGDIGVAGVSHDADGAGVALRDLNGNGTLDMVLMSDDAPWTGLPFGFGYEWNNFRYKVGYDIGTNGQATSWGPMQSVPSYGADADGAGVTFGDIDDDGYQDIILLTNTNFSGPNYFKYRIGYKVNSEGYPLLGWR